MIPAPPRVFYESSQERAGRHIVSTGQSTRTGAGETSGVGSAPATAGVGNIPSKPDTTPDSVITSEPGTPAESDATTDVSGEPVSATAVAAGCSA